MLKGKDNRRQSLIRRQPSILDLSLLRKVRAAEFRFCAINGIPLVDDQIDDADTLDLAM